MVAGRVRGSVTSAGGANPCDGEVMAAAAVVEVVAGWCGGDG